MKLVYIAGPFTADTNWQILLNVVEAKKLALNVAWLGAMPMCPHGNTDSFHGTMTPEFWYEGTLEILKRCDAIVMHWDWASSKGSCMEHAYAKEVKMPVFYQSRDTGLQYTGFKDWVDRVKK